VKRVLVTQRVDIYADRGERRDALDQRFAQFLFACGWLPMLVPNDVAIASALFEAIRPAGIVFSGGNDLVAIGGNAPERDATEEALARLGETRQVPIVGICRGMQFLVHRSGGTLARIEGHVARRHFARGTVNRDVNSFHGWGVLRCGAGWESLATTDDGSIEFAGCAARRHWGLMWHPEREREFCAEDIALFRRLLDDPVA
jgi:gamma-glutamyl-gamma-aminobutyrate hydrolase PuuD